MKSWEQDLQSDLRCLSSWSLTVAAREREKRGGKRRQQEFAHTCCKCSVAALELDAISEPWQDAPKEAHTAATRRRVCLSLSKLKCLNCIQFAAHLPHHSIFALIVQHFPPPHHPPCATLCCQCDLRHISGAPYSHTPLLLSTLSWPH